MFKKLFNPISIKKIKTEWSDDSYVIETFIMERWGVMIGKINIGYSVDEGGVPGEEASLSDLFIVEQYRERGYARKLMEAAIEYAREELGSETVRLGVLINHEWVKNWYHRLGFKLVTNQVIEMEMKL